MSSTGANSLNPQGGQGEDKKYKDQLNRVYHAFKATPKTMLEAEKATGVMRSNICWYVRDLLKSGRLAVIRVRRCSISKYPYVNEYTADVALFPKSDQLNFDF